MHGRIIEAEHLARYMWASQFVDGKRVLDAACGVGYGSRMLMDAGAATVFGVDIAEDVIASLRSLEETRLKFEVADLRSLPFEDNSFEVVTCFEAIEHVPDPEVVLDELHRVLRPNGVLAISTPNRDVYSPGNPFHLRELKPSELAEELSRRFHSVVLRRQHSWVASGIFDDETFSIGDNAAVSRADVFKAAGREPGAETYTLALASDDEIPADRPVVDLTGDIDLREWGERLNLADHVIEALPRDRDLVQEAETERLREELVVSRQQLARCEQELGRYIDFQSRLEETEHILSDYVSSTAVVNSMSWKITGPLRKLKATVARFKARIKGR